MFWLGLFPNNCDCELNWSKSCAWVMAGFSRSGCAAFRTVEGCAVCVCVGCLCGPLRVTGRLAVCHKSLK